MCQVRLQVKYSLSGLDLRRTQPSHSWLFAARLVGGVVGASAGFGLGSAVGSLVVPGVGTILAAGIGAASLLGLGGAIAGEKIGDRSEDAMDQGVPRDDVVLYRELLKRRRTLVIANLHADDMAETARTIMQQNGAENIDEARKEIRKAA